MTSWVRRWTSVRMCCDSPVPVIVRVGYDGVSVDAITADPHVATDHFGRLLLENPQRFETDRLMASIRGVLAALGPV